MKKSVIVILTIFLVSGIFISFSAKDLIYCDNLNCLEKYPDSDGHYYSKPNGCGPSTSELEYEVTRVWLSLMNIMFGIEIADIDAVCNLHDECYMTFGSSRLECDKSLLDGWIKLCEGNRYEKNCVSIMNLGYDAVKNGGQIAYDSAQKKQELYIKNGCQKW